MQVMISIDPSSTCTGWAVFEYTPKKCKLIDSGQWDLKKHNSTLIDRIDCLYENINSLCTEWSPDVAVYEKPNIFTNPKWSGAKTQNAYRKAMDATKGALWSRVGQAKCYGVTVAEWKGSKSKICTVHEVNDEYDLKLTIKENDRADSIGLGDAFLQRLGTDRAFKSDRE